jgi:hypothetical protein
MQMILAKRWRESSVRVKSDAPLAATVMMGGLLEAYFSRRSISSQARAPCLTPPPFLRMPRPAKPLQLKEWTLKNYTDVAHELGWITKTTKDIGEFVRDYRNFIHPQKELSHGIVLEPGDAEMLWEVTKSITLQILKTASVMITSPRFERLL